MLIYVKKATIVCLNSPGNEAATFLTAIEFELHGHS